MMRLFSRFITTILFLTLVFSSFFMSPEVLALVTQLNSDRDPFPRKVLLELFTATWCGPCATYGYLADEIADEFGPDKVILVRNQCWKDGLNTPETDARADFYRINGVPAMITGGMKRSHPGEVEKNRQFIQLFLKKKSPFQIRMQYNNKSLQVNLQNGSSTEYEHVRLITLLYENMVLYEGQNGEKVHKKVVRDYIEDQMGKDISFASNETIEESISVQYKMNTNKEYTFVCFLQDAETNEVYQAESIKVEKTDIPLPDLEVSHSSSLDKIVEGESCTIKTTIHNAGLAPSGTCKLELHLSLYDDWSLAETVRMPEAEIPCLASNQSSEISFHFLFPDLQAGEYPVWMLLVVDSKQEVTEINEYNVFKNPSPIHVSDPKPKIETPIPISPSEGEKISLPYTFRWIKAEGAVKYLLTISTVSSEQENHFTRLTQEPWFLFSSDESFLLANQFYRYSVTAYTEAGDKSTPSDWVSFYVNPISKTYFPLKASCVLSGISLQWEAVNDATGGYRIYRKKAYETSYPSKPINEFSIAETYYICTEELIAKETYCFIIKPLDKFLQEMKTKESVEVCITYFPIEPTPVSISIDPISLTMYPNQSKQFSAVVYDQEHRVMPNTPVQWSLQGDIGTVDSNGIFLALRKGVGKIIAKAGSIVSSADITVISHPILVTLQIGNVTATVKRDTETSTIQLDHPPFIQQGFTMVPIRFIGEAFGAKVEWNPSYHMIILEFEQKGMSILLTIDSLVAYRNGQKIILEVAPVIRNGRSFVPLRFVGETIGCQIEWNGEKQIIQMVYTE